MTAHILRGWQVSRPPFATGALQYGPVVWCGALDSLRSLRTGDELLILPSRYGIKGESLCEICLRQYAQGLEAAHVLEAEYRLVGA